MPSRFFSGLRFLTAGGLLAIGVSVAQVPAAHGVDTSGMDKTVAVKSAKDLYNFANGLWLDRTAIPADKSYVGTFDEIQQRNYSTLRSVAENAVLRLRRGRPSSSPNDLVGTLYKLAMNEKGLQRLGVAPLAAQLKRIDEVSDPADVLDEIAHLQELNVQPAFNIAVQSDDKDATRVLLTFTQGGQSLPDIGLYTDSDERSTGVRKQYLKTVSSLMQLANMPDSAVQASDALAIESILARASSTPVELRDPHNNYHLMSYEDLVALTPGLGWTAYFHRLGAPSPDSVNVQQPKFLSVVAKAIQEQPVARWRSYFRALALLAWAPYLAQDFVETQFGLTRALTGANDLLPRWQRAIQVIDVTVGDALGKLFVDEAFPPSAKAQATRMVDNIKAALRERIQTLEWMSPATRAQAVKKLEAIAVKVGYPDRWRNYSKLQLRNDSYLQCILRASNFEWKRQVAKLGKPVDRSEWGMSAPTVNAYYNPYWNEIVFPAGILQPGFYDPDADDASNYGGIGAIIGHEITHGFDDQGAQYDAHGNLQNWWTKEDKSRFDAAAAEIATQYSGYVSPEGLPVNGSLTLGENIADIGGLTIAYLAYHRALHSATPPIRDGLTGNQRFFVAFAQNYRAHLRPEAASIAIKTDPHSPDAVRVQGAVSDQLAFYRAFGLTPPENVPHIW